MSNQLLDGYEPVKHVGAGKKTPIVEITKSGEGAYLKGVLLNKKSTTEKVFNEKGEQVDKITLIATFKLIETTARLISKGNAGYAPVVEGSVKAGDEVTIYGAPTRLRQALESIEADGKYEVLIVYEGKKKEKNKSGKTSNPHTFKVGKKAAAASVDTEALPD